MLGHLLKINAYTFSQEQAVYQRTLQKSHRIKKNTNKRNGSVE